MNRIFRPVVVLLVVGVVLGLFALAGRHSKDSGKTPPAPSAAPAGVAASRDSRAALENLISLLNKDDAAGLRAQFTMPFYFEGRKIEDDLSLNEMIQKAVERPHAFAVDGVRQVTALEAGLPIEAGDVLTNDDIILMADLRDGGEPVSRIFIFRKTGSVFKVLAILKSPEQ